MASLRSLGVHKPSALPYLIAESILSEDASEADYTWEIYNDDESEGSAEEEVLTTQYHVVWSRRGIVRKIFNFELEKESVLQAILTWFPIEESSPIRSQARSSQEGLGEDLSETFLTQGTQPATDPNGPPRQPPSILEGRARALVVFLKSQAHVFFLSGASHVVNLPFEIDRAFPAARGVILQRKIPRSELVPPTPQLPAVPPNSFLSTSLSLISQNSQRYSSLLGPSRQQKARKSGAPNTLFLDELIKNTTISNTDGLPRIFSFTDPLLELGLVVKTGIANERGSLLTVNSTGRRLEPIERAEEVIYVSPQNEVRFDEDNQDKPLLLVVTANYETNIFTVWTAAYLEPKSISASRRHHVPSSSSHKLRRRSSYGPTAPGTGATTPALRTGDRVRESFGIAPRGKTGPPSFNPSQNPKERLSDQAVEDALASQLDPNFEASRHPKESRRVSSLLSRAELSTSFDKSAFQDLATQRTSLGANFGASFGASSRRGHSLGGPHDRTSFGGPSQSRHRASTPGSVVSRISLGGVSMDDTFEDLDEDSFDTIEDYDELDDLFSGTGNGGGFDQGAMDGLRKELVVSKIGEIPVQQYMKTDPTTYESPSATLEKFPRVFTLTAPLNSATFHQRKLFIYIVHTVLQAPLECELVVTRKRIFAAHSNSRTLGGKTSPRYGCVPSLGKTQSLGDMTDAIKVVDGKIERVLCLGTNEASESFLSITTGWGARLPSKFSIGPLKIFNPYAVLRSTPLRRTIGLRRTISIHQPLVRLLSSGLGATFDVADAELRRHRLRISLSPQDNVVSHIFTVLSTVLPNYAGDLLLETWWSVCKCFPAELEQASSAEWTALVVTIFSIVMPFIEDQSPVDMKSTKKPSRRTTGRTSTHPIASEGGWDDTTAWRKMFNKEAPQPNTRSWESSSWGWSQQAKPSSVLMSPPSRRSSDIQSVSMSEHIKGKKHLLPFCANLALQFIRSPMGMAINDHWRRLSLSENRDLRMTYLPQILVALHLLREEHKLDILSSGNSSDDAERLTPVLAQLGYWLKWDGWGWKRGGYYDLDGALSSSWKYEESNMAATGISQPWEAPPSILEWLSATLRLKSYISFPTLSKLIRKPTESPHSHFDLEKLISASTPRTIALLNFLRHIHETTSSAKKSVELIARSEIKPQMLSTLPESAKAPLMEAIIGCQANPPTTWSSSLLKLVQREDLDLSLASSNDFIHDVQQNQSNSMMGLQSTLYASAPRDIHSICQGIDRPEPLQPISEVERHYITRLIFNEDRRFMEAYSLLEPLKQAVAEYRPDTRSEDAAILEGQKSLMQWVMIRTFSLPVGSSMVKFNSKKPLLTEKYPLYGFSTSCLMKPMGNVVTAERANYSEEKYFWAFFNAGVAAGLSISREAQGIDTSWIMYNKPMELTNKHAGLLLGLGLNGHLKTIAKWLSFKYLTPKHTMTSVGLLLGLAASFMGTMDTLVTRLLSVHVTRMLPPGAAELNLSPYTQTTGLMGIGLLYYNTQHRRMSEIMLSEIEFVDRPDPSEPPDTLRDEAYRLAAGFALGFINLGKGKDLRGLHDMHIVERLMGVAVAPKAVDIVHILDQATAGAVVAIALIFMKTHDEAVARKIDIPDTVPQFDYVRPDIFLLRTLAKQLIMWDDIHAEHRWVIRNLPAEYQDNYNLKGITKLRSDQMPFFNILAGLLWSVSLKYAGTGDIQVRDFLIRYLDQFIRVCKLPALRYDSKLARNTVRNCQDLVALSAATVMAGTGDLDVFRRLRGLHGRVGPDTPYGSHLAAHMAFGALFVAGGTHTFSTSNKSIASLVCAFYPIYPADVQDSRAHLQAFRHFWVLATEPRCLVVRDVDTGRATTMPVLVTMKSSEEKKMLAPCLLPEFHLIDKIKTTNTEYWPATLDFTHNPLHLQTFKQTQTLHVRRRNASDMTTSSFNTTLLALNDAQSSRAARLIWDWLFQLSALREFEKVDVSAILPADPYSSTVLETRGTSVDQRLVLRALGKSWKAADLWVLKGVFEWAEAAKETDGKLRYLGWEVLEKLMAALLERGRGIEE